MTSQENPGALCNKMTLEQQQKKIKELLHDQKMIDTQRKERASNSFDDLRKEKTEK